MSDYKTYSAKTGEVEKHWYLVDAKDKNLGRLSSEIAKRLQGKHKAEYTPHTDTGDFIVVINAEKIAVKGNNKLKDKTYYKHSGYVGNLKATSLKDMLIKKPQDVLKISVKGMLPKNKLGASMLKKLKICVGDVHRYAAQKPQNLDI